MSLVYTIQSCCNGQNFTIQNLPELVYVGQTYYITQIAGLIDECYTVTSDMVSSSTIYDASSAVIIYGITDCLDIDCPTCPSPTPSVTPTITPSEEVMVGPMPFSIFTSSVECDVDISIIDVTNSPTPTPTVTPTPSSTPPFLLSELIGFKICNGPFNCGDVKRILRCDGLGYYYISEPIVSGSTVYTEGTTFIGSMNGGPQECLTYVDDIDGTATDFLSELISISTDCSTCSFTQTPTPTPTITPTATVTSTPTPTPSQVAGTNYIYSACTSPNRMVVQTLPVPGVSIGQVFQSSGTCWTYVTSAQNYVAPGGFIVISFVGNYFGTPSTTYSNCESCLTPPPSPSPTYKTWVGSWAWTISCTPCFLTAGGVPITLYSAPSVSVLVDGVYLYTNTALTTPFAPNRYFRFGQKIYEIIGGGEIIFVCNAGGSC